MRMSFDRFFVLILTVSLYSEAIRAQAVPAVQGREQENVCTNVSASITGLEDFDLDTATSSGSRGAVYEGGDFFELETNAPVYLIISGQLLTRGTTSLATKYTIDGQGESIAIGNKGSHKGSHQIRASTQLGGISAQLAGQYTGAIVLTVIPQLPIREQCNARKATVIEQPAVQEIESTSISEAENLESPRDYFYNSVTVPDEYLWAVANSESLSLFPFLAEYLAWNSGQIDTLSMQARTWWLYQVSQNNQ